MMMLLLKEFVFDGTNSPRILAVAPDDT